MKMTLVAILAFYSFHSHASSDACADSVRARIDYAYNEGGFTVRDVVGPLYGSEGPDGDGLTPKVAFYVLYTSDPEVNPGPTHRKTIHVAECTATGTREAIDKNGDGSFTLADTQRFDE
ncbi:MAG: hypothetical protein AB7G93_18075 [Bdellovibrionales bacterium]